MPCCGKARRKFQNQVNQVKQAKAVIPPVPSVSPVSHLKITQPPLRQPPLARTERIKLRQEKIRRRAERIAQRKARIEARALLNSQKPSQNT